MAVEEKEKMLSVVAYGCHKKIYEEMNKLLEKEHDVQTFFFYEYFLAKPLLKNFAEELSNISVFAPFLERILSKIDFVPKYTDYNDFVKAKHIKYAPKSKKAIEDFLGKKITIGDFFKNTKVGVKFAYEWAGKKLPEDPIIKIKFDNADKNIISGHTKTSTEYLKKRYKEEIGKIWKYSEDDANALAKEYILVIYPWLRDPELKTIDVYCVSISTQNLFYGYIFLVCPGLKDVDDSNERLRKAIQKLLIEYIKNTYAPLLALFENYWEESMLKNDISYYFFTGEFIEENSIKNLCEEIGGAFQEQLSIQNYTIEGLNKLLEVIKFYDIWLEKHLCIPLPEGIDRLISETKTYQADKYSKLSPVQQENILKLNRIILKATYPNNCPEKKGIDWAEYVYASPDLKESSDIVENSLWKLWDARKTALNNGQNKQVKDSLIFSKYLIGSPGMIEQIKTVMSLNLKKGDSLPAVLVVGSPGSGKDRMAKLIKLFSEEYRFGREYIINMAMLRPNEITVPLLMGIDIKCGSKDIRIKGLFTKAEDNKNKDNAGAQVFVFDELNSLDIDSQGSLLRIIENAKITPLGGLEEKDVDFLIIGIMNEDPESITMQKPLAEILKKEKLFGGILGDILYEYFRKIRRLRDDLYYRIIRDGKIVIPDLKNRREDIPIMFYFFVRDEMKKENKEFEIDIEVYEVLMENTLTWPGNFRQLQAIAKETIREAINDKKDHKKILSIRSIHVKNAIEKDVSLKSTS